MEKIGTCDKYMVISELNQGRELTNELRKQLFLVPNSNESCDFLLEKIISTIDNALAQVKCMSLLGNGEGSDPERSPRGERSGSDITDRDVPKKRKRMPSWSEQIRVCSRTGVVGQLDDGYGWRKYGQKNIQGSNHPRSYYRCSHQNTQGCLATKQIRRTDEDPSIFEVIRKGKHSCVHETLDHKQSLNTQKNGNNEQGLKPETQEQDSNEEQLPLVFFPSTPFQSETLEALVFLEQRTSYCPRFLSPTSSEQPYFSPGTGYNFKSSESDFADIIPNPTSFTDFQFGDFDFLIDQEVKFLNASD